MAKHPAEWWAKRVEELRRVGDPEVVARRHGVRSKTLLWWRAEFARRAREPGAGSPRLLPVVVEGAPGEGFTARGGELEVVVETGAGRVSVRGDVKAEHLDALVRRLVAAC